MIESFGLKSMDLRWSRRINRSSSSKSTQFGKKLLRPSHFPIYSSTDPRHIPYADCSHSCLRFPRHLHSNGRVEPVDLHKLRVALSHSVVLVSIFCKLPHVVAAHDDDDDADSSSFSITGVADFLQSVTPVTPFEGQLVGFGHAITDWGVPASIYDVMVIPSLRSMVN